MTRPRILTLCGSLRAESHNGLLLDSLTNVLQDHADVQQTRLPPLLPFYNADLEANPPLVVQQWRDQIAECDAVLIVSPEYNYSVPAVVKNAIDWGSRPPATAVLRGKHVAITGAATGRGGTTRGQLAFRHILLGAECEVMGAPELTVSMIGREFDEPAMRQRLDEFARAVLRFASPARIDAAAST